MVIKTVFKYLFRSCLYCALEYIFNFDLSVWIICRKVSITLGNISEPLSKSNISEPLSKSNISEPLSKSNISEPVSNLICTIS